MSRERQKQSSLEMQHCEVPVGKEQRYFGVPWIRQAGKQPASQPASQAAYYPPQTRWSLHLPIYTSVNCQPPPALQSSPVVEPERTAVFPLQNKKKREVCKSEKQDRPAYIHVMFWKIPSNNLVGSSSVLAVWWSSKFVMCGVFFCTLDAWKEEMDGWMNVCLYNGLGWCLPPVPWLWCMDTHH